MCPYYSLFGHVFASVLEIFECPENNSCSQNCVLINGTEECSCDNGYMLEDDNVTCNGMT